jgi:peptidoglycan/LPS O-acetylase OafA/YrhL
VRIEQLTFTRFIAAIVIVVFHFIPRLYPINHDYLFPFLNNANVGVSFFFILSGFVMIVAYNHNQTIHYWEFIRNRFARIYPLYILAILALYVLFLKRHNNIVYSDLFLNIFGLQAWFPGKALTFNYPAWSISVEFFFYALFPLLFNKIYKSVHIRYTVIFIIAFWFISQFTTNYIIRSAYYNSHKDFMYEFLFFFPLNHLNGFLIGNLTGFLFVLNQSSKRNYDFLILILLGGVFSLIYTDTGLVIQNGLYAILFAPLIYFMAQNNGFITKLFTKKTFVFLGEISYAIYILQCPVYYWTSSILDRWDVENKFIVFFNSLFLLIIVSAIIHLLIEVPLRNKIKTLQAKGN